MHKKIIISIACLALFAASAWGLLPAAGVLWLLEASGGSILVYDVGMGMTGVIAGLLYVDCRYQLTSCRDASSASAASQNVNAADKAPLAVKLNPASKRENPDPTKFDNPAAGARDVKPKQSVASLAAAASGGADPGPSAIMNSSSYAAATVLTFDTTAGGHVDYLKLLCTTSSGAACLTEAPHAFDGQNWHMSLNQYDSTAKKYKFVYSRATPEGCEPGYTLQSDGTCKLTDETKVKKPSTTRCEVLWDAAKGFQFDAANPNCDGLETALSGANKGLSFVTDDGYRVDVTPVDPGFRLTITSPDSSWKSVVTGPYDSGQNGYPVSGTSTGTGPATNPTGGTTGDDASGVCGADPLPPCAVRVDDSGIPDAPTTTTFAELTTAINGVETNYTSRVTTHTETDHGISWSSLMPDLLFGARPTTCSPIVVDLGGVHYWGSSTLTGQMVFDLCSNPLIAMVREVLTWLCYVGTVFYVWRRFMSAEVPTSTGGE